MLDKIVNTKTVKELWHLYNFGVYINTGNYIINKQEYLNISKDRKHEKNCLIDVQYRNTFMLLNGCQMIAVPKMEYYHIRHHGFYLQNCDIPENKEIVEEINKLLL
jgi:hypothetical protein